MSFVGGKNECEIHICNPKEGEEKKSALEARESVYCPS
jgi:hypothetical protein